MHKRLTVIPALLTQLIMNRLDADLVDQPNRRDLHQLLVLPRPRGSGPLAPCPHLRHLDPHLGQLRDVLLLLDLLEVLLGRFLALFAEAEVD
jgi:hypothetical protein